MDRLVATVRINIYSAGVALSLAEIARHAVLRMGYINKATNGTKNIHRTDLNTSAAAGTLVIIN